MDDRRFDSLVKALAAGRNRRSVLKGLLGLGGAAVIGGTALEGPAEAARRPTPTPTPIKCPGNQTPVGGVCTCPASAPHQCNPGNGPACCTDVAGGPPLPTHTECCDNACCHGTCYGEELCCPTNNRSTGEFPIPPTHRICNTNAGPECCSFDDECCLVDGCCSTGCYGGAANANYCCPEGDFCAGGSETDGICCTGSTTCCHGGTNQRACVDLGGADACCDEGDCGDPCKICDQESHTCVDRCDPGMQVCCTEQAGPGVCLNAECCPGVPCTISSDDDDEDAGICCDGTCLSSSENFFCGDGCCPIADTCCEGECCTGECLRYSEAPDVCCTTLACLEGEARECCPNVEDYKCCGTKGCCTSSACNEEVDVCCKDTEFACGLVEGNECCDIETEKCCGGLCIPASECCPSTDGDCCVPLTCADVPAYSCPREFSDGCGQTLDCSNVCPEPQFCNDSGWCDCELGQECAVDEDCCSTNCCNGTCIADGDTCVSCAPYCDCTVEANNGLDCNGGLDAGGGVCACGYCVVPLDGCPCGCDGNPDCVHCLGETCVTYNEGGSCGDSGGVCFGAYCDYCHDLGGDCSVESQCCGSLLCSGGGSCVTCKADGDSCSSGGECCNFGCANNQCYTP